MRTQNDRLNAAVRLLRRVAWFSLFFALAQPCALRAQSPIPAVKETPQQGFTVGWAASVKYEGSSSSDGTITDLAAGVGYNFTDHFGIDFGVPYYFVGTPSSTQKQNPGAVSGDGIGDFGMDLKWNYPGRLVNYLPTVHLDAPTGDKAKGLSTGHATWNWTNHLEHGWGDFTPYIDAGLGNTIQDTRYFHKPYATFGYNTSFEAGSEFDIGPLSLTASGYDIAPWGAQVEFSRVFRCRSFAKCAASGKARGRRGYNGASVQTGGASLTRDDGLNAGVEIKPVEFLDLEADYSRSVPLQLNSFSFGVTLDVAAIFRPRQ